MDVCENIKSSLYRIGSIFDMLIAIAERIARMQVNETIFGTLIITDDKGQIAETVHCVHRVAHLRKTDC